ncbi:hypothetical protein [Bartonella doshiae]|uniref:hypothetical protein n=1 Tax=Bartonella doshiae TaxID=33044 RepID=UPI001FEF2604|nr:hypothetical protein [Bartonella doshiae]
MGEAIARLLMEQSIVCRFVPLGIPDEPICHGNQLNVFAYYGIRKGGITKAVLAANRVKEYICGLKNAFREFSV